MSPLIECVPNFSEGRDPAVIDRIAAAIRSVDGVSLLDVDPGRATNRTVMTLVGAPVAVVAAALAGARAAKDLIDMRRHRGEHPRFGALDVCPLVPIADISMEQVAEHARELGRRLGEEIGLTVFLYEHAASRPERRNLADVRAGEYEGLEEKLASDDWQPDFGPVSFDPRSGATAVGARPLLLAYNVNLNTTSTRRANAVAFDVRERGRVQRQGDPLRGEIVRDAAGQPVYVAGSLPAVKAIGWYIEEYGIAQLSMNLTDLTVTPLHVAFEEVCRRAEARGLRVTGSELVGMVPLAAMLDAGRHFLRKQQRSLGIPDHEIVRIAVRTLGLDDLQPFVAERKIIEYAIADRTVRRLVDRTLVGFVEETAAESPAPGGGSVAAAVGALGAALATMVANLSAHKRGWDARWEEFSAHAVAGKAHWRRLLSLVDEDTAAFNAILAAVRLTADNDDDRAARQQAIQAATRRAIEVPLEVMAEAVAALQVCSAMVRTGIAASLSDAAVGGLCARAAVRGAALNVRINARELEDPALADAYRAKAEDLNRLAAEREEELLALVEQRMVGG